MAASDMPVHVNMDRFSTNAVPVVWSFVRENDAFSNVKLGKTSKLVQDSRVAAVGSILASSPAKFSGYARVSQQYDINFKITSEE